MMTPSPSPSMAMINIASSARKLDVNNHISLTYYYRIADNILRQADIFRAEKNIIDLYIMLLRFSSLVTETIPYHRDYRTSLQSDKIYLKKRLLGALTELEDLKSDVQRKIEELKRKQVRQVNKRSFQHDDNYPESSLEWPLVKQNNLNGYTLTKASAPGVHYNNYLGNGSPQSSITRPVEEQFRQMSLSVPRPRDETLSRHSILGPNGLYKQWQPPPSDKKVLYPSNIDCSPVEIPSKSSVRKPLENVPVVPVDRNNCETTKSESADQLKIDSQISETPKSESADQLRRDTQMSQAKEPLSLISFEATDVSVQTEIIRQPSPPPVLADIQGLIPTTSNASEADSVSNNCSANGLVASEAPLELHIPTSIMDSFMRLAKSNTVKNLETCGVLAGSLKNRKFCITALIIPKQESTSDSCQTTNEEEIFEVQDKQSLFPLGWIHTHPTQSCFMSSIDVHTHYSYQIMLPESIAIVMAPTDSSRNHGIFRLTPGGLTVIRQCPRRGFHPHDPPADGGPIYKQCTDVYINPKLKFDVIDLR